MVLLHGIPWANLEFGPEASSGFVHLVSCALEGVVGIGRVGVENGHGKRLGIGLGQGMDRGSAHQRRNLIGKW